MTHQEPWMLAVTSGTTGKSCLIPKTRDNSRAFVKFGFAVGVYHTIFGALPQVRRKKTKTILRHTRQNNSRGRIQGIGANQKRWNVLNE